MSETQTEIKTNIWDSDLPETAVAEQPAPAVHQPAPAAVVEEPKPAVPAVDYNVYLKEKFGFDSEEIADAQIKKWKETPPAPKEIEFANEHSKQLFEYLKDGKESDVYSFLSEKQKIDRLLSVKAEELKAEDAIDIIKMDYKLKFPSLTDSMIDAKINKLYNIPAAPKQAPDETDDEFLEAMEEWKQKKAEVEADRSFDAMTALPTLEKRKIDLKLPELHKAAPQEQPENSQEDLAKQAQMDADFLAKVPDTVKALQGVKVDQTVKYGDVEIPLSIPYLPSDVEKNVVATATGDSLKYLSTRWFDEQGVSSPSKVANDIFLLENKEAIFQKIASEAATQALEHYVKIRGNVNVSGEQQRTPELDKKGDVQKQLQENIWKL